MTEEVTTTEAVETVETPAAPAETADKLSNREALQKAYDKHNDGKRAQAPASDAGEPTAKEVKKDLSEEIEPPVGFSREGIAAWKAKDIAGIQKEYRRIHDSRSQEITRAQNAERKAREEAERERKEAQTWRQLGERAKPYIEARGREGVTPDQAILEALRLIDAFRTADPASAKAELKAIGIDLDAPAGRKGASEIPPELQSKIATLEEKLNRVTQKEEAQTQERLAGLFNSVFTKMGQEQNRVGETVYPDLQDSSEQGIEFAKRLGSFAFNPEFQAGVRRRFPDADFERVVREAYVVAGGRVSGEAAKVSESNQTKIDKSRRAAASTPGRVAPHKDSSTLIGKLGNRAALIQAYRDHQEH